MITNIGARVRQIREAKGLKMNFVAKSAGIAKESLSRIERGKCTPREKTLLRIADVLNVSVEKLAFDSISNPNYNIHSPQLKQIQESAEQILQSLSEIEDLLDYSKQKTV